MNGLLLIKKKYFYVIIVAILLFVLFFNVLAKGEVLKKYQIYACYASLAVTGYLAIANRKNIIAFFVYVCITYFNYSFMYNRYLSDAKSMNTLFRQCENERLYNVAIAITLLFSIILFIMDGFTGKHEKKYDDTFSSAKCEPMIVYILLAMLEIYFFIGGAVFEYGIINVVVAYMYCGDRKFLKDLIFGVTLFVFFEGVFMGLRVPVLPYLIAAVFMGYAHKINYKMLSAGFVIGVIFMTMMGIYGDYGGNYDLNLKDTFDKLSDNGCAVDTAQFAFLQSYISMKVKDLTSVAEQLDLFWQYVISQILGNGSVKYAKLALYTRQYYVHYNGLIWQYAFYFYLGWTGVVLSSIGLGCYINLLNKVKKESSDFLKALLGYFIAMIPKWYLYEPTSLFRGVMLLAVVYWGAKFMSKVLYKNIKTSIKA